jgi:hypothetical protein
MLQAVTLMAVLALGVQAPALSSTFAPDNLDGPCCAPTTLTLPAFPSTTLTSRYICWQGCQGGLNGAVRVVMVPNTTAACGIYFLNVTVTNLPGTFTLWTGNLVMTYSRTFAEASVPGNPPDTQVWRFIVNGDLQPSAALITSFGGNACVVAPCVATYNRFHVQGYIDYAQDCDTGTFQIAYALDHDCDPYEHGNVFTFRPGAFHPNRSYSWVGPNAGFVINTTTPGISGTATCDALRNFDFTMPLPDICQFEQPGATALISTDTEYCPCSSLDGQYKVQRMMVSSACGTVGETSPVDVWPGLVTKALGFWTNPAAYPYRESVHIERGFKSYTDGCDGVDYRPYFIGVQTQNGSEVYKIDGSGGTTPVSNSLIDLGNATWPGTASNPRIGRLSISDRMIQLNVD